MLWGGVRRAFGRVPRQVAAPLLPDGARRASAVLAVVCAVVTAVLGWAFAGQPRAGRLDSAVDARLEASLGGHRTVLAVAAGLGGPVPVVVMTLALVLGCVVMRRWGGAVLAGAAVPAAGGLTEWVLKPLTGRTLEGDLCFPSGHTAGAFALAAVCAVLLAAPPGRRVPAAGRLCLALAAVLGAAGVALGVVALGEHYFTDAVGGATFSVAVVLATALLIDRTRHALPRAVDLRETRPAMPDTRYRQRAEYGHG